MAVMTETKVLARTENRNESVGTTVGIGVASGLMGGLLMAVLIMITTAAMGAGFWYFPKMVMATFIGVDALVSGAVIIALGVILHFFVAAAWGVVFALLTRRLEEVGPILTAGLIFGLGVWLLMTYVVLPLINPVMAARVAVMPMTWLVVHLGYGAGLVMEALYKERGDEAAHRGHPRTYAPA